MSNGEGPRFKRQERQAVRRSEEEGHEQGPRSGDLELAGCIEARWQGLGRRIVELVRRQLIRGPQEIDRGSQEIHRSKKVNELTEVDGLPQEIDVVEEEHIESEEVDGLAQEVHGSQEVDRTQVFVVREEHVEP